MGLSQYVVLSVKTAGLRCPTVPHSKDDVDSQLLQMFDTALKSYLCRETAGDNAFLAVIFRGVLLKCIVGILED